MAERSERMNRLRIVLVTGFLGSGKTTLINQMLRYLSPKKVRAALLINDFGRVNIDAELIDESFDEKIYKVNQGSIFCVCTRDQFFSALDDITAHTPPFDIMIIEATGIANTRDLNEYLGEADYSKRLTIIENICLVDALNFHKVFKTLPAAKNQVEEATVCVINKIGMAREAGIDIEELEARIRMLNEKAAIIKTDYADIDFREVFEKPHKEWVPSGRLDRERPEEIYTVYLNSNGLIEVQEIKDFIEDLSSRSRLLRIKGFFESSEGTFFIEKIGEDLFIRPYFKDIAKNNQIVLIGEKMDEESLQAGLDKITRKS
jgi:G3E family GTPase